MPDPERWHDRMSPADALWWSLDRAPGFRTTAALLLTFRSQPEATRVRSALLELVERLPRMRERVVPVPFELAPPEWSEDRAFDLERHFQRHKVPAPGDGHTLLTAAGRVLAAPLSHDRSPWEAVLFDGLAGAVGALLLRFHHGMTDGAGLSRILDALGEGAPPLSRAHFSVTPRLNQADALLWRALQYRLEEASESASTAQMEVARAWRDPLGTVKQVARLAASATAALSKALAPQGSARVRAARAGSRRLHIERVALEGLASVATKAHASTAEVIATVIVSALDATRRDDGRAPAGIDVVFPAVAHGRCVCVDATIASATLPLVERLRSVQETMRAVAPLQRLTGYAIAARIVAGLPPALTTALERERAAGRPAVHVTRSGSDHGLTFAGRRVQAIFPFAPASAAQPTVVAAHLYRETLCLGFDNDPHVAGDPGEVAAAIAKAWRTLRAALQHQSG